MALFARGYRESTRSVLEKKIREIEEKSKKKPDKSLEKEAEALISNIDFAVTLNLITLGQAMGYKKRIEKATVEREQLERGQEPKDLNEIAGGDKAAYGKRKVQLMSMAEAQRQIEREKEKGREANQRASEQARSSQSHSSDEPERTK